MKSVPAETPKGVYPYRVETQFTVRIFDPRCGIGMSIEKQPRRSQTMALVLVRADSLEVCDPIFFELGLS